MVNQTGDAHEETDILLIDRQEKVVAIIKPSWREGTQDDV